ncbi:MAG: autotransporter-associated beta strand repeat-containing protein, partial [Candidatus Hydrogenedentes bacterium]|nr:autotransporter-associated beta strand repeat-containing protein [Candidatus Hydrogenedentota bacterium]
NLWVGGLTGAVGSWTNTANWNPADVPDSTTEIADFTSDWTGNANLTLDGPTTVNGIVFRDTNGTQFLTINVGSPTGALSFGGTSPFVSVLSGGESQPLTINPEVDYTTFDKLGSGWLRLNNLHSTDLPTSLTVSAGALWLAEANSNLVVTGAGFTKTGAGQLVLEGTMTLVGSGDITVDQGRLEVRQGSTNFTGNIVVNGSAEYVARRGYNNQFGDTNGTTTVNGNGARAKFQDPTSGTIGEHFILNGFRADGSLQMDFANVTLSGPITLNTNSHININTYNHSIRHTHISGVIDDGDATNGVTFTIGLGGASPSGPDMQWTNYVTQSRMILSGANTYGGNTYISARTATTHASNLTFTVELTNGNNRLPTSTVVYLGGQPSGIVGSDLASGRLLLNGVDQELAGLATLGSGTNNRVVAGAPTVSTLTINAASNQTYTFGGSLGGPNANEDNLVLIKRGLGTQILSGASTYTGQTIVAAGVLQAAHSAALGSTVGDTVVSNGAQLRLSGNIAIDEELTLIGSGPGGSNLGALRNVSGSNTVNGPITFAGGVGGRIQAAGDLLINGGVTSANLTVMFAPFAGASITVSNNPIDIGTATLQAHDPGTFNLNASDNVMGTFNPAWTIRANIGAADALPTNVILTMGQFSGSAASAGQGTLDMNDFDVTVGQLRSDYNAALTNPSNLVIRNSAGTIRTLAVNQSVNSTYDGRLIENISLLKDGAGTLNLGGANTYAGTTVISNGTLAINGFHLGGGQYTVAGGSLGGTGLIDAAVHVLAGGVIAPGNSIGALTVSNSFDLDGVLQIELANAAGPGAGLGDLLDVNGFFDITNGTVQF